MFRTLRVIFLVLVTVGAFAVVFGVIVAVSVVRLASSTPAGATSIAPLPDAGATSQPATTGVTAAGIQPPAGPATGRSNGNRVPTLLAMNPHADDPPSIVLNAVDARLRGNMIRRDGDTHDVIGWSQSDDWLDWRVESPVGASHSYHVDLTYACAPDMGGDFTVAVADQALAGHAQPTGSWSDFKTLRIGTIQLPGGKSRLSLRPVPGVPHELMRLRRVQLVPAATGEVITAVNAAVAPAPIAPAPQVPPLARQPGDGSLAVTGFSLIDTVPNTPIGPLADGAMLDLGVLPARHLSIRADVAGAPGSVMFGLDQNPRLHLEHTAPYAINADNNGRFIPWDPPIGQHTLTATPYVGHDANGTAGKAMTVHFTVLAAQRGRMPIVLKAEDATLRGAGFHLEQVGGGQNIGFWDKTDQSAEWPVEGPGKYNVVLTYATDNGGGGDFELKVGDQALTGHADPTGGWQSYRVVTLGAISLGRDKKAVVVKPTRLDNGKSLMNLRRVELVPAD